MKITITVIIFIFLLLVVPIAGFSFTEYTRNLEKDPHPASSSSGSASKDRSIAAISEKSEIVLIKYPKNSGKCNRYQSIDVCLDIYNLNLQNDITDIRIIEYLPDGVIFEKSSVKPKNNTSESIEWELNGLRNNHLRINYTARIDATDEITLNPTIFTAKSRDKNRAGNTKNDIVSLSNLMYISVINRPPEIKNVCFPEVPIWREETVYIFATVIDQDNDVIKCDLWSSINGYIENPRVETHTDNTSSLIFYNYSWNLSNCSSGKHKFHLIARDGKGETVNIGELEILSYTKIGLWKINKEYINPIIFVSLITALFTSIFGSIYIREKIMEKFYTMKSTIFGRIKIRKKFNSLKSKIVDRINKKLSIIKKNDGESNG
jgi:hypothetical protein